VTVLAPLDPAASDYNDRVFKRGEAAAQAHVTMIGLQLVALGGSPPLIPEKAAEFGRFVCVELTQAYVEGTIAGVNDSFASFGRQIADLTERANGPKAMTERAIEAIQGMLGCLSDEECKAVLARVLEGRSL
jgi:hypothetical protein